MPQTQSAKLISKANLAGNNWLFVLEFPQEYAFTAGQYVSVKVATDGSRRSYSIASAPGGNRIELLIDVTPMGLGSKYFLSLKEGDTVEALGPIGHFGLKEPAMNVLFVATGSGVVPFRSMLYELLARPDFGGEVLLNWGMRHENDLYWVEEFRLLEKEHPNFKLDVVLSKPTKDWHACSGHVNDCLAKHRESWAGWEAYLCGNQVMIKEVADFLAARGVRGEEIHFEKFY